ncbi:MAG: FGGY-family carbohydrate kinase [Gammaproteobacteria bacterium]|nr:FGGY-family carbohydrate kinase [Gammaproteobacteria bacterium]
MSVCYQTQDLVEAIAADGAPLQILRVDGSMVRNNYMLQKLADLLKVEVHRSWTIETTALGAALMARLQRGLFG